MSSYLQLKKRAFMSIVNGVKGFVRTVSGVPPISLEDCVDSDSLIDYKLYGNSFQDGEPTPEAPVEVVSVGEYDTETGKYKIPVTARGKNLCNSDEIEIGGLAGGVGNEFSTLSRIRTGFIAVEEGKKYIVSGRNYIFVNTHIYDANKTRIGDFKNGVEIMTGGKYVRFSLKKSDDGNFTEAELQELKQTLMFETGTTATDYEPYHAPIETNIYLDEPLRSQYHSREKQWYYDKVDYKTGTIIRNLAEKTFVGAADENWVRRVDESDTKICFFIRDISNNTSFTPDNVMCDKFVANYSYASNVNTDLEGVSLACTTNIFYIGILKSRLTDAGLTVDLDGFKTWLSQNPVTITYILKEPTEETISIPKLPTIKGTTIYETGTSLNASNMEATYYSTVKGE